MDQGIREGGHVGQIMSHFIVGKTAEQDTIAIYLFGFQPDPVLLSKSGSSIDVSLLHAESEWGLRVQGSQSCILNYMHIKSRPL